MPEKHSFFWALPKVPPPRHTMCFIFIKIKIKFEIIVWAIIDETVYDFDEYDCDNDNDEVGYKEAHLPIKMRATELAKRMETKLSK